MNIRTSLAALAIAGLAAVGTTVPAAAAPTDASTSGPSMTNVATLQVVYNGQTISNDEAVLLQNDAIKKNRQFVLVYDPKSSAKGVAHAFDSEAEADSYGQSIASSLKSSSPQPFIGRGGSGRSTNAAVPSNCPSPRNISRMYDGYNCGGFNYNFLLTDNEPDFGTTGWRNRGKSLVAGYATSGCTILVRLYPGTNYSFTAAYFYGDSNGEFYNFNSAQANNFESGRSTCS